MARFRPHADERQKFSSERGATVVLVALLLTGMLAFVGIAIDGSNAFWQQQRMQVAADAAALAGARLLALGQSADAARLEAQSLAQINGADEVIVTVVNGNRTIETIATRTVDTFFIRIVGPEVFTVSAVARAGYVAIGRTGNLLPLTTQCPEAGFVYGQTYDLRDGSLNAPGNFGWLSWSGANNAPTLAQNIATPSNSPVLAVGDWVETTTGAKYSAFVRAALDGWIGKTVTIPLYDQVRGNGNNAEYQICGFAQFELLDHTNRTISGRFVRDLIPGDALDGLPDFGARDVRMLE